MFAPLPGVWGGGHPRPTPHPLGAFGASILTHPILNFCLRYWHQRQNLMTSLEGRPMPMPMFGQHPLTRS